MNEAKIVRREEIKQDNEESRGKRKPGGNYVWFDEGFGQLPQVPDHIAGALNRGREMHSARFGQPSRVPSQTA